MKMKSLYSRSGYCMTDALMAIGCVLVALVLISVLLPRQRQLAQLSESMAQMKEIYTGYQQYALDNADRFATYSWKGGVTYPSEYPELRISYDILSSSDNQMTDLLRRRFSPSVQRLTGGIPFFSYSHLVLADYLELELPGRLFASPADEQALRAKAEPANWQQLGLPYVQWVFRSSYELSISFWQNEPPISNYSNQVIQGSSHASFFINGFLPNAYVGSRRLSEVVYPAQKTMLYDRYQRHYGSRIAFFAYPEAKVPVLAADGAVQVRTTELANRGYNPTLPEVMNSWTAFTYSPGSIEPPALTGISTNMIGHYRWTRNGLKGVDFDGREIPWP